MFIVQFLEGNKMAPLKIHNCGSYVLMEYLTCWNCVIFHAFAASCLYLESKFIFSGKFEIISLTRRTSKTDYKMKNSKFDVVYFAMKRCLSLDEGYLFKLLHILNFTYKSISNDKLKTILNVGKSTHNIYCTNYPS